MGLSNEKTTPQLTATERNIMPNCFTLTRKSAPEAGPVSLNQIDEELCEFLGEKVHPTKYVRHWFDLQGLSLALGHSCEKIRELFPDQENLEVTNWLEANFTPDAWCERY